jgi:transmembrane protein EpsG
MEGIGRIMFIIWVTLVLVYLFGFYARYFAKPANLGPDFVKPNWIPAFFAAASLVLVAGLRNNIGDTSFYMNSYRMNDFNWEFINSSKDKGFNIFQMLLQKISHDPQLLIFIVALITYVLIVFILYQYSRLFELSLYVFMTSGLFITSMNGVRQFLAAAIVFAGTRFMINGNWKSYLLIVLLAAQFHNTALVLIPIYFIIRSKAWSGTTFLLLAAAVLIVIGFNQFASVLFHLLENTQYGDYKNADYGGANVIRVFVYAVPVILAYLGREKLKRLCPFSDCIVNMSILALVFMIISTQNWIFARFTYYFGLYSVVLVSWVVKLFSEKDQKLVYFSVIICYLIYFYYDSVVSLGIIYKSDLLTW